MKNRYQENQIVQISYFGSLFQIPVNKRLNQFKVWVFRCHGIVTKNSQQEKTPRNGNYEFEGHNLLKTKQIKTTELYRLLRLVTEVLLRVVVLDFVGVDAVIGETISVLE